MHFLMNLLKNLGLILAASLLAYMLFPETTRHVFQVAGILLGAPLVMAIILVAAAILSRPHAHAGPGRASGHYWFDI